MFKSIQACRAFAALLVVLFHLGMAVASPRYFGASVFAHPFISGDAGVAFFFVLSGFIITWAHFDDFGNPARLLRYLRKRAVRIYPLYWIVFAAVFVFASLTPGLWASVPHDLPTLLKSVALLPQDPAIVGGTGAPVLIVAWSLQYEICFYMLMAAAIVSRGLGVLAGILLVANSVACELHGGDFPRSFFGNHWVLLFAFGVVLACLRRGGVRFPRPLAVASVAAALLVALGALEAVRGTGALALDRMLAFGVSSGIAMIALVQAEQSRVLRLESRWLGLLGDSSYALYLIHFPLISLGCKLILFVGFSGVLGAAVAYFPILVGCVAAAVLLHVFLEQPVLRALAIPGAPVASKPAISDRTA